MDPITAFLLGVLDDRAPWAGHMDGWGWHVWAWLLPALVVVAIGATLWSTLRGTGRNGPGGRSAVDVLDERYARGEIDREEYLRRRKDLQG